MTWLGDLLAEPLLDELPGRAPGRKPGTARLARHRPERLVELAVDLGPGDRDLQVLLARADVGDLDVEVELPLGRLRRRRLGRTRRRCSTGESRSCSPVLIDRAFLEVIRLGWLGPPSRTRRARA